ncbi:MAG: hypothetical protein N3A72_09535 [bacterium]|nr:hypothetical protein [bacterium]
MIHLLIVFLVYFILILVYIQPYQFNLSSLIKIDEQDTNYRSDFVPPGTVIFHGDGYDGQYNYYIIQDLFFNGKFNDAFRYQRILYPVLVKLVAFGNARFIPISFILVNLMSIVVGMYFLRRFIDNPKLQYLVILYGLNVGFIIGTLYDLGTPVAITLIVVGLYYLKRDNVRLTSIFFALSLLTMENALLFIGASLGYFMYKKEWNKTGYILVSIIPWVVWQLVLWRQFGVIPILSSTGAFGLPFIGIIQQIIFLLHQEYSGIHDWFRKTNVIWMIAFVVLGLIVSGYQFSKKKDIISWFLLVHVIFGLCLSHSIIWRHTLTSPARVLAGVFPLIILGYSQDNKNLSWRILLYFAWFLTLLGILRVFLLPQHPYLISR